MGVKKARVRKEQSTGFDSGVVLRASPLGARRLLVLLIEDDPQVQAVTQRILRANGYDVVCASNQEAALKHADEHRGAIALVLTDLELPDASGVDVAHSVQALCPNSGVIYMSGYPRSHLAEESGTRFLNKPFGQQELLACVAEVCRPKPR
jgi:DNA-binding NtrC family response regulator